MNIISLIFGKGWPQRIVILTAIGLYIYLGLVKPEAAKAGISGAVQTFIGMFTLIFAALLIANAISILIPTELITNYLGEESGIRGIVGGGLLAGFLQGGPYAVYPIIKSLYDKGAHISVVISMLMGYGAIGIGRVAYGLAFFDPKIVGLRVLLALPVPIITGLIVYYLL